MANEPVEILELAASENGTYPIDDIQFLDETDTARVPNTDTVKWCLTDKLGNVINGKEDEPLASALSMIVLMSGDDLEVSGEADKTFTRKGAIIKQYQRNVAVRGEIDSDIGNDLPVTKQFIFFVEEIVCL